MRNLTVDLGDRSYPVLVGSGPATGSSSSCRRPPVVRRWSPKKPSAGRWIPASTTTSSTSTMGGGQKPRVRGAVVPQWSRYGLTRADVVVAVGGEWSPTPPGSRPPFTIAGLR